MPQVKAVTPKHLRPFVFHGVDLAWEEGRNEAIAECPFCGKAKKFYVAVDTGLWQCKVCMTGTEAGGGNIYTFLRLVWEQSGATLADLEQLAHDRGLLDPVTITAWHVVKSALTGEWLVPGYSADLKMNQLYKYVRDYSSKKMKLLPTPELGHCIHGANLYDPKKPNLYCCEGPWDGMVLWEVLRTAKETPEGLRLTSSEEASIYATANVLAVPGCGSIGEPFSKWLPLFGSKRCFLMFDSDHPRTHNGQVVPPAGFSALRRAVNLMSNAEVFPSEVNYLAWGPEGYDPVLPSGYDVRDALQGRTAGERVGQLNALAARILPIPAEWISGRMKASGDGGVGQDWLPCESWPELVNAWRKSGLKWIEGLDRALSVMLAVVTSTERMGSQLWVRVISPPSSGKTVLCEAISVNRRYIYPKDTMTGLFSGFQMDKEGEEDFSLAAKLQNMTLVIKDADTLLQAPNKTQILSQFRALYDRAVRTSYGNKTSRNYEDMSTTVLLCGTNRLRELDTSELGERTVDCIIVETMDDDLEDEIGWRVVNRSFREVSMSVNGDSESPEMTRAKQLTAGYIDYLRTNMDLIARIDTEDDDAKRRIQWLAKFVAYMRARPSKVQDEKAEREMSFRLIEQMARLSACLAAVLQKRTIADPEVMARVTRCAIDTSRGRTLDLVKCLRRYGREGSEIEAIALETNQTVERERTLLRFLRKIGAVEYFKPLISHDEHQPPVEGRPRYRLSSKMIRLHDRVYGVQDASATATS